MTPAAGIYGLMVPVSDSTPANELVGRYLRAIRMHLGMDVAYLSEFVGIRSVLRDVDAPGLEAQVKVGDSYSLDDLYCRHILEGRLPHLIPDTALEPLAMAMPITHQVPIRKHMSVPIRLADGSTHGMLCCLGSSPDPSLRDRDMQMMRVVAELAAFSINQDREAAKVFEEKKQRIVAIIEEEQYSIVYQPIWNVGSKTLIGFEALTRFHAAPARPPDEWFAEAAEVGMGSALELAAVRTALAELGSFPEEIYLSVNVSAEVVSSGDLAQVLDGLPAGRVVLEITEHTQIEDYDRLRHALRPLRDRGIHLAVDDAGAGYSSLQHILQLQPDLIKLDTCLTRCIDRDSARRALATALVGFAASTGSRIIAEGVETAAELDALRTIGVEKIQGYFWGRPMPAAAATKLASEHSSVAVGACALPNTAVR